MRTGIRFFVAVLALASTQAHAQAEPSSAKPANDPGTWITSSDYPPQALALGVGGTVAFVLEIDATGRVSKCTVTQASAVEALDAATCTLLAERARFTPATDPAGKAVAGTWSNRIVWTLPAGRGAGLAPGLLVASWVVEPDGRVSDCQVEKTEGGVPPNPLSSICQANAKTRPFLDEAGQPLRKRVRVTMRVEHEDLP